VDGMRLRLPSCCLLPFRILATQQPKRRAAVKVGTLVRIVQRLFGMADLNRTLNDLIAVCRDSEEGFGKAANGVHSDLLRNRFTRTARERAEFSQELAEEVRKLGGEPASSGHPGGIQHHGWSELETRIRPKDDSSFVAECQAGEQNTLRQYEHALKRKMPPELHVKIERQRLAVARTLATLHAVEQVKTARLS
jgi:uncharacterized protein (TIGR02284 family)